MLEIKYDDSQIQAVLRELKDKLGDMSQPMDESGQYLAESVKKRFVTSTAPDGSAWAPRKASTMSAIMANISQSKRNVKKDGSLSASGQRALSGSKILKASGALEGSIAHESTSDSATIKAGGLPYAAAHQFGGKPYTIKPRNKKALAFAGIVRKSANHPGQTARPYMGFSADDQSEILNILKSYLSTT